MARVAVGVSDAGGEILRFGEGSAWLRTGGLTVIFREVDGFQPPTWPSSDVPMQVHLDLWVVHNGGASLEDLIAQDFAWQEGSEYQL